MIARLWGIPVEWEEESVILRAGSIGYRVHLSPYSYQKLRARHEGSELDLLIQHFWNEHLEAPLLAGFPEPDEQTLFNQLRKVPGLGPLSALRLLAIPVGDFLTIVRDNDAARLKGLKGVGEKTARKILGELRGHVEWIEESVARMSSSLDGERESPASVARNVQDVLVRQFGHSPQEAQRLVSEAIKRQPSIASMEELFQEVYRVGAQ
ncbi:MAG: helix-hairpin-helix domain-containing protein [Nitrospirae bacterium]|jgi:Holliday junction DNA helicase RuvA|nr:helix-hairpin-helix domain-containing protein [Nitrospirota bacterium]